MFEVTKKGALAMLDQIPDFYLRTSVIEVRSGQIRIILVCFVRFSREQTMLGMNGDCKLLQAMSERLVDKPTSRLISGYPPTLSKSIVYQKTLGKFEQRKWS